MFKGTCPSEWREARQVCSVRPQPPSQPSPEPSLSRRAVFTGAEWGRARAHTHLAL